MSLRRRQRGYLLVTVVVTLFLVASIAVLLTHDSAISANTAARELESARANYAANAGLQHALWRTGNNACLGDGTIPETALGPATYDATVSGASAGTLLKLSADQDAWIRSDDVSRNYGTMTENHIEFDVGEYKMVLTRFDLSSIATGAQISSAVAWFHIQASHPHPQGSITIHEATADWTETGVTWESFAGAYRTGAIGMIPAQDTGDAWVAVNLTAQVQAWVNGQPNFGILLATTADGTHTQYTAREDGANPPRLEVVVGSGDASPVAIKAKGKLDNGVTRLTRDRTTLTYQPPSIVTLQLGTDPGADAKLDNFYAKNYGGSTFTQVNENTGDWLERPLIRFDLGTVPAGANVVSAELELWTLKVPTPGTASIHQVTRSWVEGTKDGGGTADGATWATYDGANSWANAGGDFDSTVVAEATISTVGSWVSWEIGDLARRWLAGTPNYGVLLKGDEVLREVELATKEAADASLRPKLTITYACECGSACLSPRGTGNVLMVVGNATNPAGEDTYKKDLIESWGYTVKMIADDASQNGFDSDLALHDVLFVSETVDTSVLGEKLGNPGIGIVNTEGWLNDELGFESSNSSSWPVSNFIEVTDTSHYITAPFFAGTLEIYDDAMGGLTIGGTPASGVQSLAEIGSSSALAVMDVGAETAKGGATAGRRVMLPFGRAVNVNWTKVNSNGHVILQRSLDWAMNLDSTLRILFVVGISDSLQTKDSDRRDLFESWGHTVTIIDDSATPAEFDAELAINDVVYVGGTVVAGNLGTKLNAATIGIVNEVAGQLDDFGFHGNATANTVSSNKFTATDASHYITEPFAGGPVTHFTTSLVMPVPSAPLAPGLREVADAGITTGAIATLATGAERWDAAPSPGRRVHLPFGEAEISQVTDDGKTLVQRSLEWAGGAGSAGLGKILLVVGDSANPAAKDTDRRDLFESWGYTVELIDDGAGEADFKTALDGTDVIYVSGTVAAGGFLPSLSAMNTPIVNEDWYLVADYGFSENEGYNTTYHTLTTDQAHYINEPFGGADATIFVSGVAMLSLNGTMSDDLQLPGQVSSTVPILGAIAAGDQLWDGSPAASRRVQVPFSESDIGNLTADGQTLLKRSIEWAAGAGCDRVRPLLLVVSDAVNPTAYDTARKTLIESWCYSVTLIDDSDSQSNFDAAAAAHEVVYVSSTIGGGTLAHKLTGSPAPIVNEFSGKLDNFGFSSSTSATVSSSAFTSSDAGHYIAEPFGGSSVSVFTTSLSMPVPGGTLAPGLLNIGEVSGTAALAALEAGGTRYDSTSAPARRVHLPYGNANDTQITADGRTLMQRAIDWAAGSNLACDADYVPDLKLSEFSTEAYGSRNIQSLTHLPEGKVFNGVTAPSGGAWISVNYSDGKIYMTDMAGTYLTEVTPPIGAPTGVTYVTSGTWADHLAVTAQTTAEVQYFDLAGNLVSSFSTVSIGIAGATDIAFIDSSSSGVYDGHLAVVDSNADLVVMATQDGNPVHNFDTSGFSTTTHGMDHLPGTDKLMLIDRNATAFVVDFDGTVLRQYDADPFGTNAPEAIAINPLTCDHIVGDDSPDLVVTLNQSSGGGGGSGGAGIVFEEFTEGRQTIGVSSGFAIPKPSGTSVGDLLIVAAATDGDTVSTLSPTASWNLTQLDVGNGSGEVTFGVWWKIVDGTESSQLNYTWSGGEQAYGWIMRFTGHDPSSPIATASMNSGNNRNPQSNNLITSTDGNLILRLGGFDDDDITLDVPGLSGHTVITMDRSNTGNLNTVSGGAGYAIQTTAGDTGTSEFSLTAREQYRTVTIAIRPAP